MIERDKKIDYVKALLIILVVCGHCGIFRDFIYLFHMGVFFIISGYCINEKYYNSFSGVKRFIFKRIKALYIPYIAFNLSFCVLHNLLIKVNLYTDNAALYSDPNINDVFGASVCYYAKDIISYGKAVVLLMYSEKIGTTWFWGALFITGICWVCANYLFKKAFGQYGAYVSMVFGLVLLCVCWSVQNAGISIPLGFYIDKICYTYFLLDLGQLAKKMINVMSKSMLIAAGLPAFTSLLYAAGGGYKISFATNKIENPALIIYFSVAGFAAVISAASLLPNHKCMRWFEYIGQHTMCIMIWHFLAFKIVSLIQIFYYGKPLYYLASCPTLYIHSVFWKLLYLVVGVVIPVIIAVMWDKLKVHFKSR